MNKYIAGFKHFFLLENDYSVVDNQSVPFDALDRKDIMHETAQLNLYRMIPLTLCLLLLDVILFALQFFGVIPNPETIIPKWWFYIADGFAFLVCFIYLFVSRSMLRRNKAKTIAYQGVYRSFWTLLLISLTSLFVLTGIVRGEFAVPIVLFVLAAIFPIFDFVESLLFLLIPALGMGVAVAYGYFVGPELINPWIALLNGTLYFLLGLIISRIMFSTSLSLIYSKKRIEKTANKLQRMSETDPLTGLSNRSGLEKVTNHLWETDAKASVSMGVAILDIDFFKAYNDTFGHAKGDEVLTKIAVCMRAVLGSKCVSLARIGGEEFVIVATDLDNAHFLKLCPLFKIAL
ncbi:MAG: GGDEF domain-containing protein [Firmicutes bacterium]|nr:GGDEF domain-containing protein [Bacillota bacterium]